MDAQRMNQLLKLVLMVVAATFAPIWIPLVVVTVVPTFLVLAGIISTITLGVTTLLTIFLGVFGVPLLFSTAVTYMAYIAYKSFVRIAVKAQCFLKQSLLCELNVTAKIQSLLKGLPIVNRLVLGNGESERPLYRDESETEVETVVSRAERPSRTRFPFPRASLPQEDVEIEVFFNSVEELYSVICALRKTAQNRAVLRNGTRRNIMH